MSRNTFSGPCHRCGETVPANAGYVSGKPGAWTVTHESCIPVAVPALALDEQKARSRIHSSKHSHVVVYLDGGKYALFIKGGQYATIKIGTMAEIADYIERSSNPLYGLGI